ncbi:adenylate kinase [Entamoeba marina]
MAKVYLLMLGGPGAGKGTQCSNVVNHLKSCVHISTGDLLRAEIKNQTEIGKKVEEVIKNGQLVSDDIICAMVDNFISKTTAEVILFDGYPRAVSQLETLLKNNKTNAKTYCVNLEIPDDILVQRIVSRGKTSGRADDNSEAAQKRLKVYHDQHDDMINAIKEKNLPYYVVDNQGSIDNVFTDIKRVFEEINLH